MIERRKIKELADLRVEYWKEAYGEIPNEREFRNKQIRYLARHWEDDCFPVLIEVDKEPVACAFLIIYERLPTVKTPGTYAEIQGLYTKLEHRRQGYATALLNACIALATSKNASHIDLIALPSATPLYEKYGFKYKNVRWKEMRYEI